MGFACPDSPDRDGGRDRALKRAGGAPQRPYSGSLGFPGAGSTWARPRFAPATGPRTTRTPPTEMAGDMGCLIALRGGDKSHTELRWVSRVQRLGGPAGLKLRPVGVCLSYSRASGAGRRPAEEAGAKTCTCQISHVRGITQAPELAPGPAPQARPKLSRIEVAQVQPTFATFSWSGRMGSIDN